MQIKVVIFEDNRSLREGLVHLINGAEGFQCVGAFENCSNILHHINATQPDLVLMDIQMPGMNGIDGVKLLRQKYPNLKILMQTVFEDSEKIFQSILAGASGYILKTTSTARIFDFIKETFEGGAPMSPSVATKVLGMVVSKSTVANTGSFNLSEREKVILSCLVKGMSYKLIADDCGISIDTVRGHIRNIYEKLHVHSKGEAIAVAIKGRII